MRPAGRDTALVVLAAGSGATDAFSFVALGHVFTSVITGNLVLVGISIGALSFTDVTDILITVACYLLATAATARLLAGRVPSDARWTAALTRMLLAQAAIQAVVLALWVCAPIRLLLLGLCAVAMGAQSATVRAVPGTSLSTTYLTGTLTALMASFATGQRGSVGRAAGIGVLVTLVVGAVAEAALLRVWPAAGPALPLVVSLAVALGAPRPVRGGQPDERPG